MVPSEKNRLLTLLTVLPPSVLVVLIVFLSAMNENGGSPAGGIDVHLWNYRYSYMFGFAFASFLGALSIYGYTALSRRRAINNFLDHMHARFWTKRSKRDPEYRVSLYVPTSFGDALRCSYRTDRHPSGKRWSRTQPDDGRSADGVVGAVWLTGMTIQVSSPPERPTENELTDYRMKCHLTEEIQDSRSWPQAALLGIPIQGSQDGRPIAVLLIERNRPDARVGNVNLRDYEHDIHVCTMILQGRL